MVIITINDLQTLFTVTLGGFTVSGKLFIIGFHLGGGKGGGFPFEKVRNACCVT